MTTTLTALADPAALAVLVHGTSEALAACPGAATVRPRVTAHLVGDTNTEVSITAGNHAFTIDEPAALGGEDTGASPVEHLLAALGACQVISFKVWAAKLGIEIDEVAVDLAGDIDLRGFFGVGPDVRPGFGSIEVAVRLSGPESRETYAELVRQVEAHCPVLDNLTAGLPVTTSVTVA